MKNNKGFTLVELLATISLLAILMLIAVPNIIGVVNRNKNNTYVEDAKKLVALAEYKIRSDSQYKPTVDGGAKCFSMSFLGTGDFDTTAPNGGTYMYDKSFVKAVKNSEGKIEYSVILVENKYPSEKDGNKKDTLFIGVGVNSLVNSTSLYQDNISDLINSTDKSGNIMPIDIDHAGCTYKDGETISINN